MASDVDRFRAEYRAREIGPRYHGWLHFSFTTFGSLAAIAGALSGVRSPKAWELGLVPVFFLFANFAEYMGHKGPMHHKRRGLELIFTRHTLMHHHFFTEDRMECESSRDFQIMLFPPVLLIFFLGVVAAPIGAALFFIAGQNAGLLFIATSMGYFLSYEWMHFAWHLPPESFVGRLPPVRFLRRHHAAHHDLAKMGKWNFNITFPIFDLLLGTYWRPAA